ncbi:glycosyltransferase [Salaquimonas pukyongi]|uniref:glycosyltransferase n=1 Tax=Salaquimonas pukyongi TaxID=2712698 RepID=UPI0013BEA942
MGAEKHQLAVVLINWFHARRTLSCIHQIRKWRIVRPLLIVVCNGDTGEGRADLRKACSKRIELIEMARNTGFGGANNAGIERALALGADRILLLNCDAEIGEPDVERLLGAFGKTERLAAVGPLVVERRGKQKVEFAGGRDISQGRQTRIRHEGRNACISSGRYVYPEYVMGTALICDRTAWEKIGQFDERYFFSGEVADWCRRAQAAGFLVAVDTTVRAIHHADMAERATREGDYLYYSLRNRFLFITKHRGGQKLPLFLRWSFIAALEAGKSLVRGKWARAGACLAAVRDGWSGRFGPRHRQPVKRLS